jgi:hypothetical protein
LAPFCVTHDRRWQGDDDTVRQVMRVIERSIDKRGQRVLTPAIALKGGWNSLTVSEEE